MLVGMYVHVYLGSEKRYIHRVDMHGCVVYRAAIISARKV